MFSELIPYYFFMSYLITAVVFVLIFSILILIHELGHFIMAKRAGIKVEEFGMGLPPRIWGKKKGETIYSINLIPFGGFVRMLGEDSKDSKMLKNKRSFIAQPMRARVKVIVAGVTMNFLLAYILLTIALVAGMEPLLMPNDILPKTKEGVIQIEDGVVVKSLSDLGIENGFMEKDRVLAVNGGLISSNTDFSKITNLEVLREGEIFDFDFENETSFKELGLEMYPSTAFPRLRVLNVEDRGIYYFAGLRVGDEILKINEELVFGIEDFANAISGLSYFTMEVSRGGQKEVLVVNSLEKKSVIASYVLPNSPAEKAGILEGDIVLRIDGRLVENVDSLIQEIRNSKGELSLLINRDGVENEISVLPEASKIGVLLAMSFDFQNLSGLSLYAGTALNSIVDIKQDKYPIYSAPIKAFEESYKLSKLTASMFVNFVRNFVANGEVPDGVAGPVGIAQMTHYFVKDGLIAILRFMALLSLSLAVINILPIPALDGGRLMFIIVEWITGKKVNQKMEAYIHLAGYLLVMALIFAVTYSDIVRLITR
jgi:regulator of sigma E protease